MQVCLLVTTVTTLSDQRPKLYKEGIPANIRMPVSFESVAHDNAWIYCFHNKSTILSKARMDTL